MKTLLALGCSFTDKKFKSAEHPEMDCSWPKWPEILGEKLGYNVVNLGISGNDNTSMQRQAQDYLIEHKVDMICALWTQQHRVNIHDSISINWFPGIKIAALEAETLNKQMNLDLDCKNTDNLVLKYHFKEENREKILRYRKIRDTIINPVSLMQRMEKKHINIGIEYLRNIYTLDELGKKYNVPVYHTQGTSLWNKSNYMNWYQTFPSWPTQKNRLTTLSEKMFKDYLKAYMNSSYFKILDRQSNIYGWPFYNELGGSIPLQPADRPKPWWDMCISTIDTHPNAAGHELFASKYLEMIKL